MGLGMEARATVAGSRESGVWDGRLQSQPGKDLTLVLMFLARPA